MECSRHQSINDTENRAGIIIERLSANWDFFSTALVLMQKKCRMINKILSKKRFQVTCQSAALLLINGHYNFIRTLGIYQGKLKSICVPVLNCHSCPLALYACPLGAIQYFVMTGRPAAYVLSILAIAGITFGRMACGLLCPFGFLQDLLFKLGNVRKEVPRCLTYLKYAVLVMLVFVFTAYFAFPVFCKICPVAVLEAGFPMSLLDEDVASRLFDQDTGMFIGWMFLIKTFFLGGILVAAVSIKRPFCRILCPLGALLALFNRISIVSISVDMEKCDSCNRCTRKCPVDISIYDVPDSPECVRCMKCTSCEAVSANLRLIPLPLNKWPKKQPSATWF